MKRYLTVLGSTALLTLSACGGSGGTETEVNNTAAVTGDLALPPENGADPLAGGLDTLDSQADALGPANSLDVNATGDASSSSELNLSANSSTGNTTNTQ